MLRIALPRVKRISASHSAFSNPPPRYHHNMLLERNLSLGGRNGPSGWTAVVPSVLTSGSR